MEELTITDNKDERDSRRWRRQLIDRLSGVQVQYLDVLLDTYLISSFPLGVIALAVFWLKLAHSVGTPHQRCRVRLQLVELTSD
jgi:hypothetical protein